MSFPKRLHLSSPEPFPPAHISSPFLIRSIGAAECQNSSHPPTKVLTYITTFPNKSIRALADKVRGIQSLVTGTPIEASWFTATCRAETRKPLATFKAAPRIQKLKLQPCWVCRPVPDTTSPNINYKVGILFPTLHMWTPRLDKPRLSPTSVFWSAFTSSWTEHTQNMLKT